MAVTEEISWGDGTNDKIYLTADAFEGDQTVLVSSDANTGTARTKMVTFSASGVSPVTLTVSQEAGGLSYVMNGLVFWLDGIDKGQDNTAWVEKINGHSFTNYGATFNSNHVYLDGVDDYLMATTGVAMSVNAGTIEVVYERESYYGIIYMPGSTGLAFGFVSGYDAIVATGVNKPRYINTPSVGTASFSNDRAIANGVAMVPQGNSSNLSGQTANQFYVGKRNNSNAGYFNGKIYSIRIYNRKLTEAEVLHNFAIDIDRFNLSAFGNYIFISGYDSSNYSYASISNVAKAYTDELSNNYCQINLVTGSQAETYVYFTFDMSAIPSNATNINVSCVVKASISNASVNNIPIRNFQFYSGASAKGTASSELGTTATTYTVDGGSWTREELSNIRLRAYAKRANVNTSSSFNMRVYGCTLKITYSLS